MTSTKLSFKNISTVFNQTLKSRMVSSVIMFIISIISSVVATVSMLTVAFIPSESYDGFEKDILDTLLAALAGIIVLFSILNSVGMFSQIYKKQSCDHIFALPIKREEIFIGKYLYGAFVNMVCFFVPVAVYIIAILFLNIRIAATGIVGAVYTALSILVAYSIFMICAVISGKRSHAIILSALYYICSSQFIVGIVSSINYVWGITLNSPITRALTSSYASVDSSNYKKEIVVYLAVSVVEIIVLLAVGIVAFKRRKAECAELELFSKYIAYFILSIVVGSTFLCLVPDTASYELLFGASGATFVTFIFCEFFFRKAFTKSAVITLCFTCLVCAGFATLESTHVMDKAIYYVPEVEDVESVEFYDHKINSEVLSVNLFESNIVHSDFEDKSYKLTEKQSIENAIALHKASLTDKIKNARRDNTSLSVIRELLCSYGYYDYNYYDSYDEYSVKYHLKNGKTVIRQYSIPKGELGTQLANICRDDAVLSECIKENDDYYYLFASYCDMEDSDKIKGFDRDKFFEAYRKDIKENDNAALSVLNYYNFEDESFDYKDDPAMTDEEYSYDEEEDYPALEIELYYINEKAVVTDEDKKKVEKIKTAQPKKVINMDDEYFALDVLAIYYYSFNEDYTNTLAYLKTLGVEF